ncbi:MAG: hypothetical protein BWY22_00599 [Bacteroidetes bacterium ADurb.Bin217]|nr:MAG: hypothetical protein BWY22_00599 [Bacteroidetes bacterium ADurb.Bin217]
MKKFFTTSIMLIVTLTGMMTVSAQDCIDYHKKKCKRTQETTNYGISPDSRSALLLKGQTSEFRLLIYQGKDYRITVCNDEILGTNIQFKIIDYDTNEVLYDNKDYNYVKEFEFTVLMSRTVKIVVSVPDDSNTTAVNNSGFRAKPTSMGCVGVLIEDMITPKKGF